MIATFDRFETYISSQASFTNEELALMRSLSAEKKLSRRQLVLSEGEVCRQKVFVCKGLLRIFRRTDDGAEYVMRFSPENSWCMDIESYSNETPSKYYIEAMEESEVLIWPRENLERVMLAVPSFRAYSERLKATNLDASTNRVLMNISYTAEEKYQEFITSFPDVFRRVPLHMVASYLGVSRETLTRIRKR